MGQRTARRTAELSLASVERVPSDEMYNEEREPSPSSPQDTSSVPIQTAGAIRAAMHLLHRTPSYRYTFRAYFCALARHGVEEMLWRRTLLGDEKSLLIVYDYFRSAA